jgi:hypothetical protein
LSADSTLQQEIAVEQRHLDRVHARLARLRQEARGAERDGYRLVQVDHGGLRLGPANPVTTTLVERDAMVFHAARRRQLLEAEHEGLVFGRLDHRDGRSLYVGRLGVRDADATTLVVDWRAPAAADFYRATAADPRGFVRRRMIRSAGQTVTGLDDDLLQPGAVPAGMRVVGDGALLAGLSRATGAGMRDIVATIQLEQDEAIRAPADGVTLVEGGPGTGKTAVALHRAAYLLYADRQRFSRGVLVVGPSPTFMAYISTVLPSLGEQAATMRPLGEMVDGVHATRVDPPRLAAVKGSLRMLAVLRRAVRAQVAGAPTTLRLRWRGALLRVDARTLASIRGRTLSRRKGRNEVRRAAFDGVFDALWQEVTTQVPSFHGSRHQFEAEISERPDFRDFLRAWWPLLRPAQVLGWLADQVRLAGWADGALTAAEVPELAASFSDRPTVADVALLDELDALLGTPPRAPRPRRDPYQVVPGVRELTTFTQRQAARGPRVERDRPEYAHVVVDEAQDVSPMQWRMLARRGRRASWTVVGDPAQTAWTGDPAELVRARDVALGSRPRHEFTLTTNYRNSAEIFELAATVVRAVAPDASLPTPVRSTGIAPVDRRVPPAGVPAAVRAAAREVLAQVEGTVGVITPENRRDEVAGWVADNRVQVVTCREAKGMEYDGVVVVEPDRIRDDAGARTLYVALSRATQRLTAVATRPWR